MFAYQNTKHSANGAGKLACIFFKCALTRAAALHSATKRDANLEEREVAYLQDLSALGVHALRLQVGDLEGLVTR